MAGQVEVQAGQLNFRGILTHSENNVLPPMLHPVRLRFDSIGVEPASQAIFKCRPLWIDGTAVYLEVSWKTFTNLPRVAIV